MRHSNTICEANLIITWLEPMGESLCSPCHSSLNTEHTKRLCDLCVGALSGTEDTEGLTTDEEIVTAGARARPPHPARPG